MVMASLSMVFVHENQIKSVNVRAFIASKQTNFKD